MISKVAQMGYNHHRLRPPKDLIERVIKQTAESKVIKVFIDKQKNNPDFTPKIILGIILIKSFFAHAISAIASWNNKGMPEEQRRFSASIISMTGLLNLLSIATIGSFINKNSDKWVEALTRPYKNLKQMKNYEVAKIGARSILVIGISGILVQRALVPFIATPIAKWLKENYLIHNQPVKDTFTGYNKPAFYLSNDYAKILKLNTDTSNPFLPFELMQKQVLHKDKPAKLKA